jgi:hypothetical protein
MNANKFFLLQGFLFFLNTQKVLGCLPRGLLCLWAEIKEGEAPRASPSFLYNWMLQLEQPAQALPGRVAVVAEIPAHQPQSCLIAGDDRDAQSLFQGLDQVQHPHAGAA